jgi:hypothetical protein
MRSHRSQSSAVRRSGSKPPTRRITSVGVSTPWMTSPQVRVMVPKGVPLGGVGPVHEDPASVRHHPHAPAKGEDRVRVRRQGGEEALHMGGRDPVVRVQEHGPVAPGLGEADVACGRRADPRALQEPNARVPAGIVCRDPGRVVGRAVVHDQRLPARMGLGQEAVQSRAQRVGRIAGRDYDRHRWRRRSRILSRRAGGPGGLGCLIHHLTFHGRSRHLSPASEGRQALAGSRARRPETVSAAPTSRVKSPGRDRTPALDVQPAGTRFSRGLRRQECRVAVRSRPAALMAYRSRAHGPGRTRGRARSAGCMEEAPTPALSLHGTLPRQGCRFTVPRRRIEVFTLAGQRVRRGADATTREGPPGPVSVSTAATTPGTAHLGA